MIAHILSIILPVFLLIGLGWAYALRKGDVATDEMQVINRLTADLLCPLLIVSALNAQQFDLRAQAPLVLAGALVSLGSGALAWPLARLLGYDVRSFVPPMMYNNCGNMGLPLAALAFGTVGLSAAVALFVACNLVYFTLGIAIVRHGHPDTGEPFWRRFASPMMLSMALGIGLSLAHWHMPASLATALQMAGQASIPLMLFGLGVRMRSLRLDSWKMGLAGALACPLLGLISAALLARLFGLSGSPRAQLFLFAALPPAVFCFIVAEQYQQEPDRVASIVLLGNLLALVFVPLGLWWGSQ